jgi:hypothetical protein
MNDNQINVDDDSIENTVEDITTGVPIGTPIGVAFFVAITVIYEVLIAVIAIFLDPITAAITLSIITTLIVNAIIFLLNTKFPLKFIGSFREWASQKQANLNPRIARIIEVTKIGGIFLCAFVLGPPPTSLLIDAMGYKSPHNYLLATISGIFFCVAWISVYNGSVSLLKILIRNMSPLIGLR